jgi:hypothetical protein
MSLINEGMNEVWKELKGMRRAGYFIHTTQAADNSLPTYMAALTTSAREFTLPDELREVRSIACTSSGYEYIQFTRRSITSDEFRRAEADATAQGSSAGSGYDEYLFDIIDERTLVFAQFPEFPFVLKIRYVYALPLLDIGDATSILTAILYPWQYKILDWAAKKAVLAKHNETLTDEWRKEWQTGVLALAQGAGQRDTTAQYATGFMEE